MSIDQLLGDAARRVAADVAPPDVDLGAVRHRAQVRRRRARVAVVAAVSVAVVATGAALVDVRPDSAPGPVRPVPTPTPTQDTPVEPDRSPGSATARDVVRAAGARPTMVGVDAGDPDTRLAVWTVQGRTGAALTTDGYRTTAYVRAPWAPGEFQVLSPRDGVFLVSHVNHDVQWLVESDGTVRRVARVRLEVLPDDERLWFQCSVGGWRSTWCALDPEEATAYVWPDAWDGSAVHPGNGATPWGANPEPRAVGSTGQLEVWWGSGPDRQVRVLAEAQYGDYVLDCPPDLMALWSVASPGAGVSIHTSTDGGDTWDVATYAAPGADLWWRVRCAADGSFLAVDSERGVVVWRAERSDDAFRRVFEAAGSAASLGAADLRTVGGTAVASGTGVLATSEDSGLTWTRVEEWR